MTTRPLICNVIVTILRGSLAASGPSPRPRSAKSHSRLGRSSLSLGARNPACAGPSAPRALDGFARVWERSSCLRDDRLRHGLERMERLRVDLVDERGVVPVAGPAEFLREEKLEVDDPSHRGKVDDLDAALRADVFDV